MFSLNVLNKYNYSRSIRIGLISYIWFIDLLGKDVRIYSEPIKIVIEALDYISIDIVKFTLNWKSPTVTTTTYFKQDENLIFTRPIYNDDFTQIEQLDDILVHQKLSHSSNKILQQIYKLDTFKHISSRVTVVMTMNI